ncbi:sugar O-acetyltransferase [Bacillales bacterium AN1005]
MESISKTEKQKMLAGELYNAADPQLSQEREQIRRMTRLYNQTTESDGEIRVKMLKEMLGSTGDHLYMEPNIHFDYGYNIHVGNHFYTNFNCTILDVCEVRIGDHCLMGPDVHIYTATHPLDPIQRAAGPEYGKPVTLGNNVWIGGRAIINPGVNIGHNVVIASGAVVTKDVRDNVVVGSNPARIIKEIEVQTDSK